MIPYEKFASVYDRLEADRFSVRMAEYTLKILNRFEVEVDEALDLCCGTGTAIKIFSDRGMVMSGLDRSREMLKRTKEKLRGRNIPLYCQELPRFEIREKTMSRAPLRGFGLVTCFYDSLNYLKNERELKAAFRAVYKHLRPGGWFVFDMNTPHALKTIWGSQPPFSGVKDDVAWIFRSEFFRENTTANCYVTLFVKSGRSWKRLDETHTEKGFSDKTIKSLLKDVGLTVRGYYSCLTFEKPTGTTNRICGVVQRPEK
ncbi:MAG: class I SAM-dependent methyltransferase [bacterium]|nr:class I SAM-dependent methyltransferase [bacterium]